MVIIKIFVMHTNDIAVCKNKGKFIVFEKLDCHLQYDINLLFIVFSINCFS
jgi:hypothetical protein